MSNRDNEPLGWVLVLVVLAVGAWVYFQVKAFAEWAGIDMDTAWTMLQCSVALLGTFGIAWWFGWIGRAIFFLPCAILLCLIPALDYWSVNMIGGIALTEPAWYGQRWIQTVGFVALAAGGFFSVRQFEA